MSATVKRERKMSDEIKKIREQLDQPIPRDVISERDGGGKRKLSYLEGWYVIDRLNKILGQGNWDYSTEEMKLVHSGVVQNSYGQDVHTVHYIARVALTVRNISGPEKYGVTFIDYGYGDGSDKTNPGKAHELAVKEAVTDGLKRCAKSLGMSMGLALYDKTQENVSDAEPEKAPVPASGGKDTKAVAMGGVRAGKPETVSPGSTEDTGPVSATPPSDRKQRDKMISAMADIAIKQKKATTAQLRDYMKEKYKVEKKEELNDVQSQGFYSYLRGIISGQ
jgi:hypothetical protein